ncbi:MAG: hypothetical protein AAB916_03120 [Patescibacteria group bacterium]
MVFREKDMQRGAFITVQGIDGTGKTETVHALVCELARRGATVQNYDVYKLHDTANQYEPIKKWVETHATMPAQFDFHLVSMVYHSKTIMRLLADGQTVVRSRYIEDVYAHYTYLGVPGVHERICAAFFLRPDLRVILTLPEEIRRERITCRGVLDAKDKEAKTPGSRLDFFERFLLYTAQGMLNNGRAMIIDTSIVSVEEVVERILACLEEHGLIA